MTLGPTDEIGFSKLSYQSLKIVDMLQFKGWPLPPVITNTTLQEAADRVRNLEAYGSGTSYASIVAFEQTNPPAVQTFSKNLSYESLVIIDQLQAAGKPLPAKLSNASLAQAM